MDLEIFYDLEAMFYPPQEQVVFLQTGDYVLREDPGVLEQIECGQGVSFQESRDLRRMN